MCILPLLLVIKPSVQNCSPRSRPDVPKREKPQRGLGARGAGAFDLRDKTHPVTAGIMFDGRIGSPTMPIELNWIACIPLLLLLFGKQWIECF